MKVTTSHSDSAVTEAVEASSREASTQKTEKPDEAKPNTGVEEEKVMKSSQAESRQEEQEGGEAVRHKESLTVSKTADEPTIPLHQFEEELRVNSRCRHRKEHITLTSLPLSAGQQRQS